MYMRARAVWGGPKGMSHALGLELQVAVSCLMWELGSQLESQLRAASAVNCRAISLPLHWTPALHSSILVYNKRHVFTITLTQKCSSQPGYSHCVCLPCHLLASASFAQSLPLCLFRDEISRLVAFCAQLNRRHLKVIHVL